MEDLFYQELRRRLSTMSRQGTLYKILKEYLKPMGLWRVKPRGRAFPKGDANPGVRENITKENAKKLEKQGP